MRAIWTGAISFGLVNIPVKLFSASEPGSRLDFDMLHKEDLSPIRYARICRADGKEIPYEDIVKGYEYQKGDYVVLTEADFKKADIKKTSTISVTEFSKEEEIPVEYYEKPYYLAPQKGAERPYVLLREALKKSGKVGIARFVLRNREKIGALVSKDGVISLNQMRYKSEIRSPKELAPQNVEEVKNEEIEVALSLIDQLTRTFQPEDFKDTYTDELKEVIAQKAKGKTFKKTTTPPKATEAQDIMRMLQASLKQEKEKIRK